MSGVDKAQPEHVPARRPSQASARLRGRGVDVVPGPKVEEEPQEPKLPRHRWFEPERIPASEPAQAVIDDVLNQVQNYEKYFELRKRARRKVDQATFEATVTALISDLLFNAVSGEEPGIAITRSKTKLGRKSRYSSPVLGKTLPRVIDLLCTPEMDWLRQEMGGQEYFNENRSTTIYPTERLESRIYEHGVGIDDLATNKFRETIVLKRPKSGPFDKGERIEYEDSPVTKRYREEMALINKSLDSADIEFDDFVIDEEQAVDLQDRRLRRVFTNGSFESGGRLFGGFWQLLRKVERAKGLSINGEQVVTLDYSQMALRIAYGLVECEPPDGDGYELPDLEEYRAAVKIIFNSALSSDRRPKRAPKGTREFLPRQISFMSVLSQLEVHHTPIVPLFYKSEGHRIQFIESQILVALLLRLQDQEIVALPIHDAVIIAKSDADTTKTTMEQVFKEMTGIDGIVRAE